MALSTSDSEGDEGKRKEEKLMTEKFPDVHRFPLARPPITCVLTYSQSVSQSEVAKEL